MCIEVEGFGNAEGQLMEGGMVARKKEETLQEAAIEAAQVLRSGKRKTGGWLARC